jgi:Tfp pilus assembly protein FimT
MLRCAQHDNRTRACRKGKVCSAAAFSLAELVLVVAIIAIISAIAVPRYASALVRYRADAAARRVVADLSLARHLARQTGQSRTVTFNTVTGRVRIIGQSGMDAPASNYETNLAAAPYQAAITAADFGGDATIIFNGYGVPDSGGAATVAAGDATKTIAVDAVTGQASIQ